MLWDIRLNSFGDSHESPDDSDVILKVADDLYNGK